MKTQLFRLSTLVVVSAIVYSSCSSDDPGSVDCTTLSVSVPAADRQDPTSCGASDGSITATATGGQEPYQFSLNSGPFQSNPEFVNLGAGEYSVTVRDANSCEKSVQSIVLTIPGTTIDFTASATNSGCKTGEASMTVSATGGSGDYAYSIAGGSFGASNVFNGLTAGSKSVTIRDNADNCTITKSVMVLTGVSYDAQIKPIITSSCAVSSCHVSGGEAPFALASVADAQAHAAEIKTATGNGSMPKDGAPLTQLQKDLIACWVDDGAPNN